MPRPKLARVEIQPLLLSYDDAAKMLGIATQTLRNGVSLWLQGKPSRVKGLRPVYFGGKPVFRFTDLQRFVATLPDQPGAPEEADMTGNGKRDRVKNRQA
jgi:hypothetical protein